MAQSTSSWAVKPAAPAGAAEGRGLPIPLLEMLRQGVVLLDRSGRVVFENAAIRNLRDRAECIRAGRLVLAQLVRVQARSDAGRYIVLVVMERAVAEPLSAAELHQRFQLTQREVTVSQLLALGFTNNEVACHLGISIHTARRHVERVLMKLGVHSRARVAARLLPH